MPAVAAARQSGAEPKRLAMVFGDEAYCYALRASALRAKFKSAPDAEAWRAGELSWFSFYYTAVSFLGSHAGWRAH
jgi:hypothetical protein